MKNIAIILAGGSGKRLGAPQPKQFLEVAGKTVVEHTIEAFERHPHIHEIAIVANADYLPEFEAIVRRNPWKKVRKILLGGKERYDSSLSAIRAYAEEKVPKAGCATAEEAAEINLILHDAVRPMVSWRIISDVVAALQEHKAVGVAIPSTDTIWQAEGGFIAGIPNRSSLMRAQTPQAFRLEVLEKAYALALADPDFRATDDCGVVLKYLPSQSIFIVEGEESNIKLTFKEDLPLLERHLGEASAV